MNRPPICKDASPSCGKHQFESLLRNQAELLKRAWRRIDRLEAALAARDGPETTTAPSPAPARPVVPADVRGFEPAPLQRGERAVTVPADSDMDNATLLRHLAARHEAPSPRVSHTVTAFRHFHLIAHVNANGRAGHVHSAPKSTDRSNRQEAK